MIKIGVIVDGAGDFASLKSRYQDKVRVLKTDGPRGHCAEMNQIVSKSKKQISILKSYRCSKIIILIDFECRNKPYKEFVNALKKYFQSVYGEEVVACSPNTMIENWYFSGY